MGRGRDEGDVGDVDVVLHDVMRKITKAMTIPTVIAMTMPIHCWLLLSRHQYKTLVFLRLSKQKLRNGPQNKKKKKEDEQHGTCDTFAKTSPTNKSKLLWKKTPKHRLADENHTKLEVFRVLTTKPPKNNRHTPRGGRRTCFLVVVAAAVAVGTDKDSSP